MELTWYDSSPWADVFINNVFSTLPSSDGRKISLKDAFPLGGITYDRAGNVRSGYLQDTKLISAESISDIIFLHVVCNLWCMNMNTYSSVKGRYVKMPAGCKH